VPASDTRTVGELLADCDALARDTLLDVGPNTGPAMARAWGEVVQSAAQLWAVLPPASLAPASGPDPMVRLRVLGEGLGRSTAGRWPGPGPQDQRLLEIARNLSDTRELVERYGRDVQPTIDPEMTDRLTARLDASQVAWSRLAKRWGELTSPDSRPDPALARAAGEVRAAIAATASTPTGWATSDQIASRGDLNRTLRSLHLSIVGAVDIAHVAREVAATQPTLTAPARVIAMRAQGEAEIAREQGVNAYDGITWATSPQIATNQLIPLPGPVHRGLVNLTSDVIATCNQAVATAAPLDPSESAQPKKSGPPPALRRSGQDRTMRPQERASEGFRR
jgi:hypothetical protein